MSSPRCPYAHSPCLTLLSLSLSLFILCSRHAAAASTSIVSISPGLVVSVATNSSTGSVHLLAFDPLTGSSRSGPSIEPWWSSWDSNATVVIDPSTAFGDWFLHEDGLVYYLLFISNTAQPRSQKMTQYVLYDPTKPGGWIAPTPGSSCMISQASSAIQPALENVHLQRSLGTMIGFTDFSLQDQAIKSNSTFLGLVSLMWNEPTCFLWPIMSFAQGLPTSLKVASAAAVQQDSVPLTFSYVGAIDANQDSASIVMLDVSSPINATLLSPPSFSQASFSLGQINVTDLETFQPALVGVQSPAVNQPTFGLVQTMPATSSAERSKRSNKLPATYLQFDDAHSTVDGSLVLDYFPAGPATTAPGTDERGQPFLALVGLVATGAAGEGQGAAAFFTGLGDGWALRGEPVDPEWDVQPGATLSFVPRSIVPSTEAEQLATKRTATRLAFRKTPTSVAAASPAPPALSPLVSSPLAASTAGGDPDYHRPDNGPGLTTGQIVLIVVLVVAFFGGLCACWVLFERRRARQEGVDPGLALTATQRKVHMARMSKRQELVDEDGVAMGMAYEPPSRGRSSMSFDQDI